MKKRKCGIMDYLAAVIIVMLLVCGFGAQAASFRPLLEQEKAHLGATHEATITYADFTQTNTNTAVTLTNVFPVLAKQGVELKAMQLVTAFDTANTNYTGSVAVTVGDGTDADLYLTSTELASDGTEVWVKLGRSVQEATSGVVTQVVGGVTNAITVLTALTDDSTGRKVYTAADTVDFTFTPNAEEALDALTVGEVRFYFKITP
jgi:hypothetical protein